MSSCFSEGTGLLKIERFCWGKKGGGLNIVQRYSNLKERKIKSLISFELDEYHNGLDVRKFRLL